MIKHEAIADKQSDYTRLRDCFVPHSKDVLIEFGAVIFLRKKYIYHNYEFWHGFGLTLHMKVVFKKTKAVKKDSCTIVSLFAKKIMELKEIHFSTLNLPGFIA